MDKYFYISYEKELKDSILLIEKIKEEGWISPSTVLVNCSPDYSSRLVQLVNHKLSYLNGNEPFECIPLEMPYPTMSQIYNPCEGEYELFDKYLTEWTRKYITKGNNYLFINSGTLRGRNFTKVKLSIKTKLEYENYRFASLYLQSSSIFQPNYYVEEFDKEKQGGLLFEWENVNNPNWDY